MANPTSRTLERVNYLRDPATVDALLDAFQSAGMPMGSDRWAEHCLALLKQYSEEARALGRVMQCLDNARTERASGCARLWLEHRRKMTREYQEESARREAGDAEGSE